MENVLSTIYVLDIHLLNIKSQALDFKYNEEGDSSIKDNKNVLESQDLLKCVYELPVIDRWWIDHLFNELSVTVGVGCGHVDKHLQMLHSVSQINHLLCGQHIQLHGISAAKRQKKLWNTATLQKQEKIWLTYHQKNWSNHDNLQLV